MLRGEISAVETYTHASLSIDDAEVTETLNQICAAHEMAVDALRTQILDLGGVPEAEAGAWGALARTVEGAATLVGTRATLSTLKTGEQTGASSYEEALERDLPVFSKNLIDGKLLPQTRDHIIVLDDLIALLK